MSFHRTSELDGDTRAAGDRLSFLLSRNGPDWLLMDSAADEIERLRAAIKYVRDRSAHAGEILNEFNATYDQSE